MRLWNQLSVFLLAERDRWILWLPVFIGMGIWAYYTLPKTEPSLWFSISCVSLLASLVLFLRRRPVSFLIGIIFLAISVGFALAHIRTSIIHTPILTRDTGPVRIEGKLDGVETLDNGYRLRLSHLTLEKFSPAQTPKAVRIRWSGEGAMPRVGSRLRILGVLSPPSESVAPGSFDFRRHAYFNGLGAIGYALSDPEIIDPPPQDTGSLFQNTLEAFREHIATRIRQTMPQPAQGIVHALMTGEQTAIPKTTMNDMRFSGLAHLLSISGMHIGMVAGAVFFLTRAVLALIPAIAVRWPIKKWAAALAIVATVAYTVLVESPVPAQRAALMSTVVLLAVIADRQALSMRMLAFAAVAVLCVAPESVLSISFQMSFAAVAALIAAYEVLRQISPVVQQERGWTKRGLLYLGGILLTSAVATLATLPFSLYHFQQIVLYGLVSNMLAVPVTGFFLMPAVMLAYAAMPFGLEEWPLRCAGWATDAILWIAHVTASLPGARWTIPALPDEGLALMLLGGLWLCLWARGWRLAGLVPLALGVASFMWISHPDILVSSDGRLWAVRDQQGRLMLSSRTVDKFDAQVWQQRDGQGGSSQIWPLNGAVKGADLACDGEGCLYRHKGHVVAFIRRKSAALEDCAIADVVISDQWLTGCKAPLVIDRRRLLNLGGHALAFREQSVHVSTVRVQDENRPWQGN